MKILWVGAVLMGAMQWQDLAAQDLAVVNQKEHRVVLVDTTTRKEVGSVSVGVNGHEVAASPDKTMLYVPIYGSSGVGRPGTDGSTIDVVDVAERKLAGSIDLGRPLRPHKDVFGPDGMLYCSSELANAIQIVDVTRRAVVGEIPTGAKESHMFVLSADGKRAWTANVDDGSVSALDVVQRKVLKVIPLTRRVQRMAVSNDGKWVWTSDIDQPRFAVIDTRKNELNRWVATSGVPYVTQPTADGKYLLVLETKDGKGLMEAFRIADWTAVKSFALGGPQTGGFLLHGPMVYWSEPAAGTIEVLNQQTWMLQEPIVLTPGVDGLAWVGR